MATIKREHIIKRGNRDFVLYPGLLDAAFDEGLKRIETRVLQFPSTENGQTAVVHATVTTGKGSFGGIGDASPESVAKHIVPHLLRMAETRAKARALRDAINAAAAVAEDDVDLDEASAEPHAQASRTSTPPVPPPAPAAQPKPQPFVARVCTRDGEGTVAHVELPSQDPPRAAARLFAEGPPEIAERDLPEDTQKLILTWRRNINGTKSLAELERVHDGLLKARQMIPGAALEILERDYEARAGALKAARGHG